MRTLTGIRLLTATALLLANPGLGGAAAAPSARAAQARPAAQTAAVSAAFGDPYLVADLTTTGTPEGVAPASLVTFGGAVYFVGNTPADGRELHRSNGTLTGTAQFMEINPGAANGIDALSFGADLVPHNGRLYFAGETAHYGSELWSTDGTVTNTLLVRDIATGTEEGPPRPAGAVCRRVVFHGRRRRAWRGTVEDRRHQWRHGAGQG